MPVIPKSIAKLIGFGGFLPSKVVTNEDISKLVDTTNEWIIERTGIEQRHISDKTTSHMSVSAAKSAIKSANINPEEIDLIIVATTTPDLTFPSVSCLVQQEVGAVNASAFDIQAACAGFVYGLYVVKQFIESGAHKKILLIGADKMSSVIDWSDRSTCILFGDGAGAVIISADCADGCDGGDGGDERDAIANDGAPLALGSGIIDSAIYSDSSLIDILRTNDGISTNGVAGNVEMSGQEVFRHAVTKMTAMIENMLKKNNMSSNDIDFVVPHQANNRITAAVMKKLKLPISRAISTVSKHGNTSAASIPLALNDSVANGTIKKGDVVVFVAIGAGLTSGCTICRI